MEQDWQDIGKYEPILTIGTIAQMLGVAVQTVRLYEEEGLVIPWRTNSGRRMFSLSDAERLKCVRKMITEYGINLAGVKRLLSLIPCWEFKGGLDSDCKSCPAYYEASAPCWSLRSKGQKCMVVDCRECPVYRIEISCEKMKEIIFGHKLPVELSNYKTSNETNMREAKK